VIRRVTHKAHPFVPVVKNTRSSGLEMLKANQKTGIRMAKTDFKFVDEYIASQPETVQGVLERVRNG
jgi:hypothetical protein